MYVLSTECAAEKWCAANDIDIPKIASWEDAHRFLGKSKYRIERAFDDCPKWLKEILLALADLEVADLAATHYSGLKLHHYTTKGQAKIAHALRKVRLLSEIFPRSVTAREFTQIDRNRIVQKLKNSNQPNKEN